MKRKIRFTIYISLIVLLLSLLVLELMFASKNMNKKLLAYTKESNINYVTYLKDNNHYSDTYLQDDFNFVASLIDYFNIDYNYSYTLSESIDYKLEYEVVGLLEIYDSDYDTKPIEKQEYQLVEKTVKEDYGQVIKTEILNQRVDYDTYNKIVEAWKREVSPNASLKIIFKANWQGYSKTLNKEISDNFSNEFVIPISDKTITITKPSVTSETNYITGDERVEAWIIILIASTGILLLLVIIILILYIIKINNQKSKYEQKINKYLREFDRAITEAKGKFYKQENEFYIEVNDFMELMDVHDNLNEPIIYYKNSERQSVFIVRNDKDVYFWKIEREDFE